MNGKEEKEGILLCNTVFQNQREVEKIGMGSPLPAIRSSATRTTHYCMLHARRALARNKREGKYLGREWEMDRRVRDVELPNLT